MVRCSSRRRSIVGLAGCALLGVASRGLATPIETAPPNTLRLAVGAFDAFEKSHRASELGLQFRWGATIWRLNPIAGAMATSQGSFNAYAGAGLDLRLGKAAVLRPSFAPGLYARGDGKYLGSALEFRSALELAFEPWAGHRLGLEFCHLSNASLGDTNPGSESLVVTYALPIGGRARR